MVSQIFKNQKVTIFFSFLYLVLFIFSIYPGTGGEGGQKHLKAMNLKIDWWNFFPALIYGNWPGNALPWRYSLGIFQTLVFILGIFLIYRRLSQISSKILLIILSIIFLFFVAQVLRDASMLSIYTFSVGILLNSDVNKNKFKNILISLSVLTAIIGGLFRPVFAPLFGLIYFFIFMRFLVYRLNRITLIIILGSVCVFPWLLDQDFSKKFHLEKSFPQQQVMIYDLSKLACWGHTTELKNFAKESLRPLLNEKNNFESVCASLTPAGWDHLRSKIDDVRGSPVLTRIAIGDEKKYEKLQKAWIDSIRFYPFEWLLIKSVDLSQVMFMANTFYSPEFFADESSKKLINIGNGIIKIPYKFVEFADKLRIFSIIFAILFGVLLLMTSGTKFIISGEFKTDLNIFVVINIVILIWLSFTFVANNGRYAAPFTFLAYIYLLLARDISLKKL